MQGSTWERDASDQHQVHLSVVSSVQLPNVAEALQGSHLLRPKVIALPGLPKC